MNNQELFEAARTGNWIAETFDRPNVSDGIGKFYLTGTSKGYSTFGDSLSDGDVVFYAAFDDDCNREAGYGLYNKDDQSITPIESTATLANGVYIDGDVAPISFPNGGTITGTFNAVAFNAIWAHIWDKNNPHEVIAEQVEQDNENNLGDNVQDALDNLSGIIAEWDAAIKATCQNYVSELPPANPKKGDMWTDVGVSGEQYVWEGDYWVSVTGGGLGVDLEDPDVLPHDIVRDDVQGRDELYDKKLVRVINSYDGSGHWELAPTGGSGDGSGGSYDDTQIKADLATETRERKEADTALSDRIDGLSIPDGYDDTQIRADLNQETEDRIKADAALGVQVGTLEQSLTALATSLAFGGSFSAATGTIVEGAKEGIEDGAAIPNAADHHNTFLICVAGGDNPATLVEGDWLVSNDVEWVPVAYASGSGGSVDWLNVENKPDLYTQEESNERFQEKGDYQPAGDYLTDFTESDPTVPPHVKGITETNISDWDKASTDAGTAISWGNHADAGYAKAEDIDAIGDDSGWELKGESVVYTSNNDSGVYIVDEREEYMFNRAQLYMVNQEEMAGGWLGAEYNALQLGVVVGANPEDPAKGVRNPIVTLHKDGMQCAIGSWQKPDSDEKLYVVGDGKFTGTVQATNFLDADGNSIVGGGDPDWAKVSGSGTAIGVGADVGSGGTSYGWGAYSESRGVALGWQAVATDEGAIAVGDEARVEYESAIAIGQNASCNGRYGIALGYQTQAEENQFTICDQIDEVQFGDAELRVRAVSAEEYLDADGNSIIGAGGGGGAEAIEATFYETVELMPQDQDTGGTTIEYKNYWVVDDNNGEGGSTRTNIYANGTIESAGLTAYTVNAVNFVGHTRYSKFQGVNSFIRNSFTLDSNVFGAINILAADEERPPELPYSPDEKSVLYALTVTHETLGRTVEIDKEGIIRANQFTDMAGNPVSVSPATMVEAFTTLQTAVADEDTLEGVKTALTNALGGLIEKFEGMKNV